MKEVFISYTEGDDDFRIVGDDYKQVLERLCLFLNDQTNFPYRFSLEPPQKEWTAEKFEPAVETEFDDLDDGITYCVYCYDEVPEWKGSCCGENHFLTGKEIKDYEKELSYIDKRVKGASQ